MRTSLQELVTLPEKLPGSTEALDSLKANLVEYEERYELCKQEHAETVRQLEKLTTDFEQLRTNLHVSRTATDSNEELLNVG